MNYLVTGAGRGIGRATVLQLAARPEDHVFAISRTPATLATLREAVRDRYGTDNVTTLAADLTTLKPEELLTWAGARGPLHGVVNNAGWLVNKPFLELTAEDWEHSFAVNFFAVVDLLRTLHPLFESTHIVNVGSMSGYQSSAKFPGLAAYGTAKAALANLTECLAAEWKDTGIRVNCLALGAVQTEMLATAFPGYTAPVKSEEMGEMVAWFLREGGRFFNGKVLPVAMATP